MHFCGCRKKLKKHLSGSAFVGGISIEEMSIKEDLCMVTTSGEVKLVGFVDMGSVTDHLSILYPEKRKRVLATHVLSFLYRGLDGFRFPFACFPET